MGRTGRHNLRRERDRVRTAARPPRHAPHRHASISNYAADAGAGSHIITNISESPGWRAALLGTVAAGSLWLYSARVARAGPQPCTISGAAPNQTATCQGNQSAGIASGADFIAADVETLNVNTLTTNIAPAAGVDGIYFNRIGPGQNIIINSDTTPFDIVVTGAGADGIYAYSRQAGVTINHIGDIDASTGGRGIDAMGDGPISITTAGEITGGTNGIRALFTGGGPAALAITANGDVVGIASTGISAVGTSYLTDLTIESRNVSGGLDGIFAGNGGTGATIVVANGDVVGAIRAGILATNSAAATGPISITSQAVTGSTYGIRARNYGTGALEIVTNGNVVGTAANSIGIDAYNSVNSVEGITIETHQAVSGAGYGILANNIGDDAMTIVANGDVVGTNRTGIFARA
jgi:hypothetical protein